MSRIPISVLVFAATSACLCHPAEEPTIPPQATPVVHLLKAIEDEDLELFKTCYSARMRDVFARRGWQGAFSQYIRARKAGFRNLEAPEIRYDFFGEVGSAVSRDFVSGNVLAIVFKETWVAFELDVINEGGEWRIDDDRLARDVWIRGVLRVAREK